MGRLCPFIGPVINSSTGAVVTDTRWYFYEAGGTSVAKDTFPTRADAEAGTNANANPIVGNASGMPSTVPWLQNDAAYRMVIKNSTGSTTYLDIDNITGVSSNRWKNGEKIYDDSGNEYLEFIKNSSSNVNHLTASGGTAGNPVVIGAKGDDSDININITPKGSGVVNFGGTVSFTNALTIDHEDTRTNTVKDLFILESTTSNSPAAGIGTGILFRAESADEVPSDFGRVDIRATDVSAGSEDTELVVGLRSAGGSIAPKYSLRSTSSANKVIITHAASSDRTITIPDADVNLTQRVVRAYRNTSVQTLSSGSTTLVQLNGEDFDPSSEFDNATNYRFTPLVSGYYNVSGQVCFSSNPATTGSSYIVYIYKNGSAIARNAFIKASSSTGAFVLNVQVLVNLNGSTDYIDLRAFQNTGSSLDILNGSTETVLQASRVL